MPKTKPVSACFSDRAAPTPTFSRPRFATGELSSAERTPEVNRPYEPTIRVRVNSAPLGHHRAGGEVVTRPAREHNDLKAVGFLRQQRAKPVHPAVVALNELVVQDNRCAQIFRERQPVQGGQLLASADRDLMPLAAALPRPPRLLWPIAR